MKNRIRKIMGITTVVVLSAALLAGCGGKKKDEKKETETTQETQAPEVPELEASTGTVVSLKSLFLISPTRIKKVKRILKQEIR